MLYKIWFFLWAALVAILAVENMVVGSFAYIFLDQSASAGMLALVSAAIWIVMWYSAPYVFSNTTKTEESFEDF